MKRFSLKNCLAASALLLVMAAIPARAQGPGDQAVPPIEQWEKGDWWEVTLEQMALYAHSETTDWRESFVLRFEVTEATKKTAKVLVTTYPESLFKERLQLEYNHKGDITSAQIVHAQGTSPLGEAGGPGVFGMLGREAFDLSQHPKSKGGNGNGNGNGSQVRVEVGKKGKAHQKWVPGDTFWSEFESTDELPQRGKRVKGVFSKQGKK